MFPITHQTFFYMLTIKSRYPYCNIKYHVALRSKPNHPALPFPQLPTESLQALLRYAFPCAHSRK